MRQNMQDLNSEQMAIANLKTYLAKGYYSNDDAAKIKKEYVKLPNLSTMNMQYLAAAIFFVKSITAANGAITDLDKYDMNFQPYKLIMETLPFHLNKQKDTPEIRRKRNEVLFSYSLLIVGFQTPAGNDDESESEDEIDDEGESESEDEGESEDDDLDLENLEISSM